MRTVLLIALGTALLSAQEEAPTAEATPLPDDGQGYDHLERFIHILETVRTNHPDVEKLAYERLVNHALEGMLDSLDLFSGFYHPETYAYIKENEREPELPGLGLTLGKSSTFLTVTAVRDNSPADRAGVSPGDRLLRIGEEETEALSLTEAIGRLSGRVGENVAITLRRRTDRETYDVSLLRAVVKQEAVSEASLLEESGEQKIGYISLTEFTGPSHRELEAALDELEDKGMKSLILDLRGNPGGLLQRAVDILGEFVPPSTEVVFTKGRQAAHDAPPMKTPERKRKKRDYPLAILVDRKSASASELVAGALQDLERARVVGETSYGKGSVQQIKPMEGGTALRLTIATYHTPSGRTPHEVGIIPDVPVEISEDDRTLLRLWHRRESATPEERESLQSWKDPVVAAARQALAE